MKATIPQPSWTTPPHAMWEIPEIWRYRKTYDVIDRRGSHPAYKCGSNCLPICMISNTKANPHLVYATFAKRFSKPRSTTRSVCFICDWPAVRSTTSRISSFWA